LKKRSR